VSNNKKKMLRDAKKKRAEYLAEHQKQGCETINPSTAVQRADETAVADSTPLSSMPRTMIEKEPIRLNKTRVVNVEEKAAAVSVAKTIVSNNKEVVVIAAEKKAAERSSERQTYNVETPITAATSQMDDKMIAPDNSIFSSNKCNTLDEELIELVEFTTMVKNTSAFHLQEKASALPSPGFTVSNNKKKMLRDIERKYAELLQERKKYGCEALTKE
jgi:hypothetical protein